MTKFPDIDPEFDAMWNDQLLDYPTISRSDDGTWNYFDVTPAQPEMIYEDGKCRSLDGATEYDVQQAQGEELAQQTLALAARHYEADSCALTLVVDAAHKVMADMQADPDRGFIAAMFIDEILDAAIRGRDRVD
jgi:hypothetical protein